jgi:transcription elongation factor GreB
VTLEDEDGQALSVRIVGPDEFDHAAGYISMDSPLARALLKRAAGDEVQVKVPDGARHYLIVEVSYPDP